ncbi:HlyD family secretion protein [Aquamicrobium sp. LC103]|uniref:HlyD family secretion protein n=1 Tax=Aquamicrobium sp. LC103 TaxID=1120658 RepID=UPI000A5D417A|nr:HlyD family secretion protein [Aquamicrobium sp. LC103]
MNKIVEIQKDSDASPEILERISATSEPLQTPPKRSRHLRPIIAVAVLIALGAVAAPWLAERWSHVAINDARIAANLVTVSSEASGRVTSVEIIAGDAVKKGQLLATIDNEQTLLELKALDAQIAGIGAQQSQYGAQQEMIRTQVASKLEAGESEVRAAEANHAASEAALRSARSRFERVNSLARSNVTSAQVLDEAEAALATAEQQEKAAAAGIATANSNLAVVRSEGAQIDVLNHQIATLETQKSALVAQREQKRVDLSHREIRADFDGVIDSTFIDAGEYVSPGTRLLIYHDPNTVWVDANVKETDFGRVKLGAPAKITVDAFPDMKLQGEVERLGEAATSQFALLPSPNPSGNFTKITQRLPLRISIDQSEGRLRPGMMVEVSVDVVD